MITLSCPHCGNTALIKFGTNRSGTPRCRCHGCGRTFTRAPKNRTMTPEREALILGALKERISQRGIARALKVGRQTIRAVRKKGQTA
jgi:transposase-like protein